MKKFLSLLLTAAMLLSLTPTVIFAAETDAAPQEVKLYDVHITGNVVIGGTLTANFEPADPDVAKACGLDMEQTIASIQWYYKNRYGARSSGTKTLNNDGNITYTVPSTYSTSNSPAIFFKITPKNADDDAIGDTVYSTISYVPQTINSEATAPVAYNAHISPLNGDGIIDVGETVAARYAFTYKKSASIGEMNSRYTWYTSDELLASADDIEANATKVQDESTNAIYTIKPADAGKYLYAKIIAVASDGAEAKSAVYTKNHLGNGFLPNSNSVTGHSVSATSDDCSGFNKQTSYPAIKLVADGCSPISNDNTPSTYVQAYNVNTETDRILTINAGKIINFDGIYLAYGQARLRKIVISYSNDNTNWTDIVVDSSCNYVNPGEKEFLFDNVLNAQYFRLLVWSSNGLLNIDEFYPFLKNDAWVGEYTNPVFAALTDNVIEVQAWGTPLAELHKKSNGFTLTSDYDAEETTTNADEIIANNISYVSKSVTSDGDVYTTIDNPENIYVTENTTNTYMKVVGKNGISQYFEVKYAGNIYTKEDEVVTNAYNTGGATVLSLLGGAKNLKHFDDEGNAIGKYLLKTQVEIPSASSGSGLRTKFNASHGGKSLGTILILNGYSGATEGWQRLEIGVPNNDTHTGYSFIKNRYLDVEILFDFDSTFEDVAEGESKKIKITTWIDGILIDSAKHTWTDPVAAGGAADTLNVSLQIYNTKPADIVHHKNSSLRQVWDANTHVVENDYELNVVSTSDTTTPVTKVTEGSYTVSNNMNVYRDISYTNYIAKYYVSGDTAELITVTAVTDMAQHYVTVTEDEIANHDVVIKALSVSNLLKPNFVTTVVKE